MELFFIIGLGAVLIFILTAFRSETKDRFVVVNKRIIKLQKELEQVSGTSLETSRTQKVKPIQSPSNDVIQSKIEAKPKPAFKPTPPPIVEEKKEEIKAVEKEVAPQKEEEKKEAPKVAAMVSTPVVTKKPTKSEALKTKVPKKEKEPRDYEKLIGENWLNKIGIAILVIGIGFFVKYAIDQDWIGEVGRVGIGLGTGGLLIGIAHFLKNKYRAFSSVLIGGGISVFYYTIAIAYHDYGIFDQNSAFGIMTVITLASTVMAVLYDRKELAIIALIGGFTSPFMVQGEQADFMAFFTYIAILNMGMLLLSYFKNWNILHKLSLGFTLLFFGGWMIMENVLLLGKLQAGLLFSTIFFFQFLGMSLIYNLKNKVKFTAWEFIQMLSVISLYYGAMMYIITNTPLDVYGGIFTLIFAALLAGLGFLVRASKTADQNMAKFLIAKVVTLVTVFVLVQFKGDYLALFWSVEAVVLLFIGQKMKMPILKNASVLITIISFLGLLKTWVFTYLWWTEPGEMTIVFNEVFMTALFAIGTYVATTFLLRKEDEENELFYFKVVHYKYFLNVISFGGLYLMGLFELTEQLNLSYSNGESLVVLIYNLAFVCLGLLLSINKGTSVRKIIFLTAGSIVTLLYFVHGLPLTMNIIEDAKVGIAGEGFFAAHYLMSGLFVLILILANNIIKTFTKDKQENNVAFISFSILGLIACCAELEFTSIGLFADGISDIAAVRSNVRVAGYTVLVGLFSFLMMIIGMRKKERSIRIFALVFFGITLVKLFALDIQNISEGGKIVAFISLGALLLVVSFLYQKLKNLIVDGEFEKTEIETNTNPQEVELK
ncbi:MAG: putative membrane protein [Arenicella sp.]|jgi:uncharacterized membrane protein